MITHWQAVYQQLTTLITHDKLVDTVLPALGRSLPATQVELYLNHQGRCIDADSPALTLAGTWGLDAETAAARATCARAQRGPAGWVMQHGQPFVTGDAHPDLPLPPKAGFLPQLLYVPLQRPGRCLGVLGLGRPGDQSFTSDDVSAVQSLAGQVALVLENIALRREQGQLAASRRRIQTQAALIHISQTLNSANSLEAVLDLVLEAGFSLMGEREGSILLLDERTNTLRIVASRGIPSEIVAAFNARPVYAHEGTYTRAIRTGQIVEVPDTAADPDFLRDVGSVAQRVTNVPLRIGQRVIGILALDTLPANDQARELLRALADMAAVAIEKARLLAQVQAEARRTQDQLHKSARLYEISTRLHAARQLETLLHNAVRDIAQVFAAPAAEITLFDGEGALKARVAVGLPDAVLHETAPRPSGSVHTIRRTGQPLVVSDANLAPAMIHPRLRQAGIAALLGLPLRGRERILGVVRALFDQPRYFLQDEVDTLATYSNQVAVAIENVRLYQNLEDLLLETIRALVHAFEAKDLYSAQHSEAVMRYAVALARELGLDESRCRVIQFGALLHDIGKIGVSDRILLKEETLDTGEWYLMRTHPVIGAEIVRGIRPLRDVVAMIRHHHERHDGLGYPDGLAGQAIPLGARILAVVDSFESMTSDRAYREALSVAEALERLEAGVGRQWDGRIVHVWCDLVRRQGRALLGVKWDQLVKEKLKHEPRPAHTPGPSLAERSSLAYLPNEAVEAIPDSALWGPVPSNKSITRR